MKKAGTVPVAFDADGLWDIAANAPTWEKVVLKMRAGVMPPAGAPRPDKTARGAFLGWLEGELDRAAAARPNPGRTEPFHRLNRTEYRNAIRDLLALDLDVSSMLPADDASYGFDNIAGVLKMSPTLMEQYLAAAQRVSRLAVGTPVPAPSIEYIRITDDLSQDVHLPGLPFGTRGGTQFNYVFPMDAEYEIRVRITRDLNESVPVYTDDAARRDRHRRRARRRLHAARCWHAAAATRSAGPEARSRRLRGRRSARAPADLADRRRHPRDGAAARGAEQG